MNVVGIVGWKNSGKTSLVVKLVELFVARGLSVSTIKHAHHEFDIDRPGKDSYLHRQAGAREVLVASGQRWALMHELRGEEEPPLEELLTHLAPADLVIVEGFKHGAYPKLEIRRAGQEESPLAAEDGHVIAIVSDEAEQHSALPVLPLDNPLKVAQFIAAHFHLRFPAVSPVAAGME